MNATVVELSKVIRVHYGAALKEADRVQSGSHDVFGASGVVGRHSEFLFEYPSIVIGRKGSVGAVTYAPVGGWAIDTAFFVERRDPNGCDLRYLFYALKNARLARHTITTAIPGLSRDDIYRTRILLPRIDEQRRIADILDKADAIRLKRKQAIALTEELLRSAFLDMFGDPVKNPKGWPMSTFGAEVSLLEYGPRFYNEKYSDDGVRIVRITDLDMSGALDFKSMPRLIVDARDQERYVLRPGDVIFARSGATVGKTSLSEQGDPPAIPGAYFIRLRFEDSVLPRYARQVLASGSIQQIIVSRSRQSAQQNFSGPGIRELPLPLPPRKAQERLESIARRQMRHLAQLRNAQQAADTLFTSVVARAFSGGLSS